MVATSRGSRCKAGLHANCTHSYCNLCTLTAMDVAISELRAHLSEWIDRASRGDEVVITDRGLPVARLLGLGTSTSTRTIDDRGPHRTAGTHGAAHGVRARPPSCPTLGSRLGQ